MRSPYSFIITPKNGDRYDNKKTIEGQEIVISSSLDDYTVTNRYGLVKALPMYYNGHIEVGDTVIVHHNVFRIYYDMKGREKSSWNHLVDDLFIIEEDQLYLYRKNDNSEWKAPNEFCFIKPIGNDNEGEVIQTIGHDNHDHVLHQCLDNGSLGIAVIKPAFWGASGHPPTCSPKCGYPPRKIPESLDNYS